MRCLVFFMVLALCGCNQPETGSSLADAIADVKRTEAYVLAKAEAGDIDIDPADPRVAETALALDSAAAFFDADRKEIAKVAFHYAWQARKAGTPITAVAILTDGPAVVKARPKIGQNLAGFRRFAETYIESARFAYLADQQARNN